MKKNFVKQLILFIIIGSIHQAAFSQAYDIILGRPTDTSITASVMFPQPGQFYIMYGTQSGNYSNTTNSVSNGINIPDEIDIRNLQPNTKYYYQLRYKPTGSSSFINSNEFSFQTQRPPGSTFTFTIEADEHLYDKKGVDNMYNVTLDNQAKDKPDFMISLGDIFGDDHSYLDHTYSITAGELDTLHRNYRPFLGKICNSIPFFVCLGNHEGERKYHFTHPPPPDNLPINGTIARKKYFPNPVPNGFYSGNPASEPYNVGQPENYYAWTWGDALFVVLDVYRYDSRSDTTPKPTGWDWTLGIDQYLWLKSTLENSTAKYKFVFCHHIRGEGRGGVTNAVTNEWGGYQRVINDTIGDGYTFTANRPASEGWTVPIHQLFRDNHVNILFQGHDHVFAHEKLNGITYQAVPMAADSTYEIGKLANAGAYLSDTLDGTGHIRVTVSPSCVKVDYVKAYLPADTLLGVHHNQEIGFSYTIGDCAITPPPPPPPVSSVSVIRSEILGQPTDNSILVNAFFSDSVTVQVKYGLAPGVYANQTPWQTFAGGEPATISLTGLQANTQYYYQIFYKALHDTVTIIRPEHQFHTQRPVGTAFNFVVQADPHMDEQSDSTVYSLCLQNQLDDHPDFMIDLGDFLMTDKLKNRTTNQIPRDTIPYRCNLLRQYYEKVCHSLPLFIALGNHEGEAGWNLNNTANNIAVWGTLDRKKYFLNPVPTSFFSGDTTNNNFVGKRAAYYSWNWGDALFVVIDPYWSTAPKPDSLHGWRWTLGKTQYDWLKATLSGSNAKFKFVFAHQIIGGDPDGRGGVEFAKRYEWGGYDIDDTTYSFATNRPGWDMPIKDLFKRYKVNIFFHGHDHFYGKQEKDCLVYQEVPQPSHPNPSNSDLVTYADDYGYHEGIIQASSGHLRVNVSSSGVRVDYVRTYPSSVEDATHHNKDVSATYFIGTTNCYDSSGNSNNGDTTLTTISPVLWNLNTIQDIVYPNPFSIQTRIEFNQVNTDHLYLYIYNAQGQLIRKMFKGEMVPKGKYFVVWDGKSSSGGPLPNGTYIYTIIQGTKHIKSGKIVLIR